MTLKERIRTAVKTSEQAHQEGLEANRCLVVSATALGGGEVDKNIDFLKQRATAGRATIREVLARSGLSVLETLTLPQRFDSNDILNFEGLLRFPERILDAVNPQTTEHYNPVGFLGSPVPTEECSTIHAIAILLTREMESCFPLWHKRCHLVVDSEHTQINGPKYVTAVTAAQIIAFLTQGGKATATVAIVGRKKE